MRRLYLKIYLTIIVSLLMVVVVAGAIWRAGWERSPAGQAFEMAGELAAAALPPADAPRAQQQQAIERLAERLGTDFALYDGISRSWPAPEVNCRGLIATAPARSSVRAGRRGASASRTAAFSSPACRCGIAIPPSASCCFSVPSHCWWRSCAYPVVRGLTRRLERLQTGVETLGAGDLKARVKVEGRDEVARLAASFNRAATRIEELVNAHRMLLSNASHELRTPLSRIRLAIELFQEKGDAKYKAELEHDIAELDLLIDEILMASRLDATRALPSSEQVDLLALVAEEGTRYDCVPDGEPVVVRGDPRLLRRLVRNLIENARRHGKPPLRLEVRAENALAVLSVMDGGDGVPQAERERVFQPFHRLGTEGNGAGLGLALVRQIARLHGGDAVVAPRADAPSCFRITLPRA